jgi:hypothetical protein
VAFGKDDLSRHSGQSSAFERERVRPGVGGQRGPIEPFHERLAVDGYSDGGEVLTGTVLHLESDRRNLSVELLDRLRAILANRCVAARRRADEKRSAGRAQLVAVALVDAGVVRVQALGRARVGPEGDSRCCNG